MKHSTLEQKKIDPRLKAEAISVDRGLCKIVSCWSTNPTTPHVETPSTAVVGTPCCFRAAGAPLGFLTLAEE